jgi:hypothetical protein
VIGECVAGQDVPTPGTGDFYANGHNELTETEKAVPAGAARDDRYPSAFMSSLGVGN